MNATRTACILSAGILLVATIPALAEPPDSRGARSFRDRRPQAMAPQRQFRPAVRDTFVGPPVFVERRAFVRRPVARQVVVARPIYVRPPFVVYDRPLYYSEPTYYVGAAPAYLPPPPPYYSAPAYYVSAAPAPAAAAYPPPPPPPPVARPTPAPKRFTFSADALFDFDQAIVKAEGRRQLDKLAADLTGAKFDVIKMTVAGHTDRLGSAAYNMRLSMHRAEAVKAYMVELGIPAAKIVATGKGETHPVTKPGECKGEKATKELMACLQPDRRVEIEVSVAK